MEEEVAVAVREAYKRYSSNIILKGLNMTVMKGHIYGLLGPSGCGKTTLLSCIIGMKQLDCGNISVAIKRKHQLGYMPQEIALNSEFSIMEVFQFYGGLYKLDQEQIYIRGEELISFLELPPSNRTVGSCSGGQQRRVSMAVTLLHDASLLILDEPTVGVDPVLCHKIWKYFVEMVKLSKKTIIITTHYIEEAKNSNCIGLMRGGVLLAEESPTDLMTRFNCPSMEEVFLQLAKKQEQGDNEVKSPLTYPGRNPNEVPLASKDYLNSKRLQAQITKNINWTLKNIPVTLFVVCLPALLFFILGEMAVHGSTYGATLAILSEEPPCVPPQRFEAGSNCGYLKYLSCRYLDVLSKNYYMATVASIEEGNAMVKKGRALATVYFPANYSQHMLERLIRQGATSKIAVDNSMISVWADKSEYPKWIVLFRDLWKNLISCIQDVCDDCGFNRKVADIPLSIEESIYEGNPEYSLTSSFVPTFFCIISFYTTSMFTSSAIVMERISGSYDRSQAAGLTLVEIMTAHVVIQVAVMSAQNLLSFMVIYGIYDYPVYGNPWLALLLINAVEIFGMCYGFFLATIIRIEVQNTYAGIATVLTLVMLGGVFWPLEGIHWFLRPIANVLPTVPAGHSYYNIMLRGRGIGGEQVLWGYSINILCSILFLALTGVAVKFKLARL